MRSARSSPRSTSAYAVVRPMPRITATSGTEYVRRRTCRILSSDREGAVRNSGRSFGSGSKCVSMTLIGQCEWASVTPFSTAPGRQGHRRRSSQLVARRKDDQIAGLCCAGSSANPAISGCESEVLQNVRPPAGGRGHSASGIRGHNYGIGSGARTCRSALSRGEFRGERYRVVRCVTAGPSTTSTGGTLTQSRSASLVLRIEVTMSASWVVCSAVSWSKRCRRTDRR